MSILDLSKLQEKLGITFRDVSLLKQALVHSSYINENPGPGLISNERLEFLGDAVLDMVIAEALFKKFPASSEGELTRLRASIVRTETLAEAARTLELGNYLYLGKGEESGGGRTKIINLAGALESLVASIYLDRGLDTARNFILKLFGPEISTPLLRRAIPDYKSQLQEIFQAKWQITPEYHLIGAVGPDHDKRFTVEVRAGETVLGKGTGKSKKAAEMEAAREALENLPDIH